MLCTRHLFWNAETHIFSVRWKLCFRVSKFPQSENHSAGIPARVWNNGIGMEWVASALEGAATGVGTEALTNLIRKVAELGGVWNGLVLKTERGAPYVIAHAPHEPHLRLPEGVLQADESSDWRYADGYAWLVVPLPVPELFYVLRTTPEQQSRAEWRIAAQLATLLGQHERFHRELNALKRLSEQRLTALGTLYETAIASERGGLEHFLRLATRRAAQAMDAQACTLMLLDEKSQTLSIAASYGLPDKLIAEARVPLGEGVAGKVALTGEPMLIGELDAEPSLRHLPRRAEGLHIDNGWQVRDGAWAYDGWDEAHLRITGLNARAFDLWVELEAVQDGILAAYLPSTPEAEMKAWRDYILFVGGYNNTRTRFRIFGPEVSSSEQMMTPGRHTLQFTRRDGNSGRCSTASRFCTPATRTRTSR